MGIMPPDTVTIEISGSSGTITGNMAGFTVTPGLRLYPGSNGGPDGPGREIQSYVQNGTAGATVTFAKPFTSSYVPGTKFYIAEGAPAGTAAYLVNQLQRVISYFAGTFGQDLSLDSSSQQIPLRRAPGSSFARLAFYLGLTGGALTFLFGQRTVAGREVLTLQASPDGNQLLDSLEVDRATGGVEFLSVEIGVGLAPTVDLGAIRSRRVFISGQGTITSFGAYAHKEKIVRFDGFVNINVSGLPAIRTTPGDVMVLTFDALGLPRLVSYRRATSRNLFDATIVMGNTGAIDAPAGSIRYLTHGQLGGSAPTVYQPLPLGGRFHSLRVVLPDLVPSGESLTFTLQKLFSDTALTCKIGAGGTAGNAASDLEHVVAFDAGERWCIKVAASAGATIPSYIAFSIVFEATE